MCLRDDPNVDDVHRRGLIVYFVEDPDAARVQPVHARGAPRDRIRRRGIAEPDPTVADENGAIILDAEEMARVIEKFRTYGKQPPLEQ